MGIGSILSNAVKGVTSGIMVQDGMQDWSHAAKVFTAEDMIRSPKMKGMYHVSFIFNDNVINTSEGKAFGQAMNASRSGSDILSVLTRSVDLPTFDIDTKTYNQYNKTTHSYRKMKYNPVHITFHDDMTDYVWALWAFYYCWYFADGNIGYNGLPSKGNGKTSANANIYKQAVDKIVSFASNIFNKSKTGSDQTQPTNSSSSPPMAGGAAQWDLANNYPLLLQAFGEAQIDNNWTDAWGMNGTAFHSKDQPGGKSLHLLRAIEIYPLGTKKASVIVLHNPKITSWAHDTFDYSNKETATCKMQLVYEGVTYLDQISAATVLETVRFYDRHQSPLMRGSPRSLLGAGGILDRAEGVIGNIANGNFGLSDLITTVGIAKSLGDSKVTGGVKSELNQAVKNSVSPNNINKQFPVPATGRGG